MHTTPKPKNSLPNNPEAAEMFASITSPTPTSIQKFPAKKTSSFSIVGSKSTLYTKFYDTEFQRLIYFQILKVQHQAVTVNVICNRHSDTYLLQIDTR